MPFIVSFIAASVVRSESCIEETSIRQNTHKFPALNITTGERNRATSHFSSFYPYLGGKTILVHLHSFSLTNIILFREWGATNISWKQKDGNSSSSLFDSSFTVGNFSLSTILFVRFWFVTTICIGIWTAGFRCFRRFLQRWYYAMVFCLFHLVIITDLFNNSLHARLSVTSITALSIIIIMTNLPLSSFCL
jgi:hypothetical protein